MTLQKALKIILVELNSMERSPYNLKEFREARRIAEHLVMNSNEEISKQTKES